MAGKFCQCICQWLEDFKKLILIPTIAYWAYDRYDKLHDTTPLANLYGQTIISVCKHQFLPFAIFLLAIYNTDPPSQADTDRAVQSNVSQL